jgi:rfaE bifunctional protein kinase chain/domain
MHYLNIRRVLVIGDTILDHYVYGSVSRVNPEAPHSVVLDYEKEEFRLGGACNVAKNIKKLAPEVQVDFAGAVSDTVSDLLSECEIACMEDTHVNSQILLKTRFVSNNHHILRLDTNKSYQFDNNFYLKILSKIENNNYDLIVISDYNKGTIYSDFSKKIFETGISIIFDVKAAKNLPMMKSKFIKYENVILKCNKSEFYNEIKTEHTTRVLAVVETRGAEGYRIHSSEHWSYKQPVVADKNFAVDVVGAGDTFLAGMAAQYLQSGTICDGKIVLDFNVDDMCSFGNICAAAKVKHFGTYAVGIEDLS